MKHLSLVWCTLAIWLPLIATDTIDETNLLIIALDQAQEQEILTSTDSYAYIGPEGGIFAQDLLHIKDKSVQKMPHLTLLCERIGNGNTTAPAYLIDAALQEAFASLSQSSEHDAQQMIQPLNIYYQAFKEGIFEITAQDILYIDESTIRSRSTKCYCFLKIKKLIAQCLFVTGNAFIGGNLTVSQNQTISGNLTVSGSETIGRDLTVLGTITGTISPVIVGDLELIGDPDVCIIFRDAALVEKARICSSAIPGDNGLYVSVDSGATQNLRVTDPGGVVIATPSSGVALTIDGGGQTIVDGDLQLLSGDVILPVAGASGLLTLGGTNAATNVFIYEFGNRNLFAGNGAANLAVTGADNISFGSSANSALTTGNNTIAIGTSASATATDSIAIGDTANTTVARTIVIGSRDSTSTGVAPTASGLNAIAIGSANGINDGPVASGTSAIAVGSADATMTGASATADQSIAVGANATATATATIAIGSGSGSVGGLGPRATGINAIAIGTANGAHPGATSSGISSIAIGSADPSFDGAIAGVDRSIALGLSARANAILSIAIGSASGSLGGNAATTNGNGAIAIGSGSSLVAGPVASGLASVAIGSASGLVSGASAGGARSVAIGNGASAPNADTMVLGNAAVTAYRVGIGTTSPNSKLHIQGQAGNPVIRLAAGSTAITSQPVWDNRFTQGIMGTPIHFDASGRFFGLTSSARYKQNIRNITDESEILYKLNPVIYDAKEGHGEGKDIPGFIAEQVFEVAPTLAVLNIDGQPENVAYNSLHALAIKEIQKQQKLIEEQQIIIDQQGILINKLLELVNYSK